VIRSNYNYTPADRVLQFFSLNFDGAVEEIFPTLMSGATLVLRPNDVVMSVDELLDLAAKERLTVLDVPTAYWHELAFELDHYKKILPESVRLVITGGEAASPERYATWKKNVGDRVQWLNTYGPTEGTVIATIYDPAANPDHDMLTMPIGAPLANDKIYIVDQNLNLTPIGVPGELCIGGLGVARGYLNRPDLTAEKFIPDPFSQQPGARLYRTGDLVRWLPNGNIQFLGRIDQQVKVRGFRIEPGEIEAVLREIPGVKDVIVLAREDIPGDKRLVAYLVCDEPKPRVQALREKLSAQLPDYMVPSAFVFLEAMPLTPNGKIDRRALPKPELDRSMAQAEYVAPRDETEEKLCAIVGDLLHLDKVGIHDNFFELGGHSLLATQFMSRLRTDFQVELPLITLFEKPTVAQLAEEIAKAKLQPQKTAAPAIKKRERRRVKRSDLGK
ncbi:non-ribosomal peptide synthetase, partial [candidate division KSB1 bacterium]